MAPPGTKFLIHETPQQRRTWDFYGKEGWYIGISALHYRCYRIFIPDTRGECITKTIQFFPHKGAMPVMSSANAAKNASRRLADAPANPAPAAPFASFGAHTVDAIQQLVDIFAATSAPSNPTQPTRYTHTTVQLPRRQHSTNPQAHPRVPLAVPPSSTPIPPPYPPQRVETPTRDPFHRYPLRSRAQANHTVETIVEGSVAFQGVLDPATEKTKGIPSSYADPIKTPGPQRSPTKLEGWRKV